MFPKKEQAKEKSDLHLRNKHRQRYDFQELIKSFPELKKFVKINPYGDESVDFFDPKAVKMLNKALLKHNYDIHFWEIPDNYLCPPIPSRADYIHHVADLLATCNHGKIPKNSQVKCLDIGVGANCIYPIIGSKEYGWNFVGTDIHEISVKSAQKIIDSDAFLKEKIEIRLQKEAKNIFSGIIDQNECFDLSVCNPPFHSSLAESQAGTIRKLKNLNHKKITKAKLNFGGQHNELFCEGGEEKFIQNMIFQSVTFANSCFWFSTLVAKQEHLKNIYQYLEKAEVREIKTAQMKQGNKISRIVAWTFLDKTQQKIWAESRWNDLK